MKSFLFGSLVAVTIDGSKFRGVVMDTSGERPGVQMTSGGAFRYPEPEDVELLSNQSSYRPAANTTAAPSEGDSTPPARAAKAPRAQRGAKGSKIVPMPKADAPAVPAA